MANIVKQLIFVLWSLLPLHAHSQSAIFDLSLEPVSIAELGGLQSYAYGQHNGKWLIIGGRLDGLHRRQPFAAFNSAGHNTQIFVVDPVAKENWTAPLTSLPLPLQEQLQSTNMQFYQAGKYLYLTGGYGYSASQKDHTTFPYLTAVDVPVTIHAIINNADYSSGIRQITDNLFQVTGGRLEKINNTFYLVGGHKFIGRYNPMGPDHGPGFEQEYTNQIRKFNLADDGTHITIHHLPAITDTDNLHRRDFNVTAQILPDGTEGLTAFSGVFQQNADLPFLNCVHIDSAGYQVNNAFNQYYNHYHCAHFPMYSAAMNEMNTVFFGGIAQYYDDAGVLTQNNDVPFVKTIARVSGNVNGVLAEYKLPVEMPALLGAGAEFIPNESVSRYANGVIKYDELPNGTTLIGYIYGGISSTAANIFWVNEGTQSKASQQLFKVLLTKNGTGGQHILNKQSTGTLQVQVSADTDTEIFSVNYNLMKPSDVKFSLHTNAGKKVDEQLFRKQPAGINKYSRRIKSISKGGTFLLTIETPYEKATQKMVIEL